MFQNEVTFNEDMGSQVYLDYLYNFDPLKDFFELSPWQESSFEKQAKKLQEREANRRTFRNQLTLGLHNYHKKFTDNPKVYNTIELLNDPETMTVVTGQQPGIMTGPLFAIYKIITAIKLSKKLSKNLDANVIPIFWICSDDHDFQEVNWLKTVDHKGEQLLYEIHDDKEGFSIGDRDIKHKSQDLLDKLAQQLQDSPYYDKWMTLFSKTLEQSKTLADWTAAIILELFGNEGVLVIDPMKPVFRQLSKPIFSKALDLGEGLHNSIDSQTEKLNNRGYSGQVDLRVNHSGLFYYYQGIRSPLTVEGDQFLLANLGIEKSKEDLVRELESDPAKFSPNVTLRPVLQDFLLPSLAYVAGPGEISYFAQLKQIYEQFEIGMPVIYPRESYLLLESDVKSILEKYQIGPENIFYDWPTTRKRVFRELAPINTEKVLNDTCRTIKEEHEKFIQELSRLDEKIYDFEEKNFHLIYRQLYYLKEKGDQYFRRQQLQAQRDLDYSKIKIYPLDKLQEREYNIGEFLCKYDSSVLKKLLKTPLNPQKISVVDLE
ncbi:bacillithiol biosynthesis cysteine-adding enzyme BshC [Natranaerobius thermophilus]|uniref:bacillithiol biosynthesis cysteine-adding enzyme BshC n=1 Tax=Natranaerobius thermophilus TaxID=375929 RepID=UPI002F4005B7